MAFGNMTPAVAGQVASSAANNQIITNVENLDTRLDVTEALTTNTATNGGQGNARLADRFGTGVGTGANVTTGSATSQLTDVRSRITVVENRTLAAGSGNAALDTRVTSLEAASGGLAPYCKLVQTSAQSIAATATLVDWHSTVKSRGVTVNLTNNTVTILTAGIYWLTSNVSRAAATGSGGTRWLKNGATLANGDKFDVSGNAAAYITDIQNNILVELAVNDIISLQAFSSSTQNTSIADGHASSMSVLFASAP
jgi:hypothetical protein